MSKKTITTTFSHLAVGVTAALGTGWMLPAHAAETHWSGYVENATYFRDGVGLSKFRNTGQARFETVFDTEDFRLLKLNGTLRATYDGVYDLNDDEFGRGSRHAYLGENWHDNSTLSSRVLLTPGVSFPCENDPTLCKNLSGYMGHEEYEAKFPDFNDQLDFIRELYLSADKELSNGDILSFRLGKQQVVWGKTDLFRVLDVINPVDYSRHNIYDELEDIRIPQWMLTAEWRMGPNTIFDDSNLSLVWNFDKFRPNNLGTCGQAYRIVDAGCFFASYLNAGPGIPIIHDVEDPDWSLANTQVGLKWEGVYGDATFSLNALSYRQQMPSLHFRPNPDPALAGLPAFDGVFDIHFPRVNLFGGAIDYYSMDMDATWRLEVAYTEGEELPDDSGHHETDMLRYVIGMDKNIIIPELGTRSAFLLSTQLFGEHILDHISTMPNDEDNWIATLLFKGFYKNNRLSPQIIIAHDFAAKATVVAPSVSWTPDNHWMFNLGLNVKTGGDETFPWGVAQSLGDSTGQFEPTARFLNGPIGVANQEDELQFTIRYSF